MPEDQRNFLLALAMSLLVIVLWEVWVSPRITEDTPKKVETKAAMPAPAPIQGAKSAIPFQKSAAQKKDGAPSAIIRIENKPLAGSLRQTGAVFNNISLTQYAETLAENSPPVQFFKPDQFEAVFGWSNVKGEIIGANTEWRTQQKQLTPATPITLTYQDKTTQLYFERKISIDENYMFRIEDKVENKSNTAQQISPWSLLQRLNRPKISGFYLLHEGLIGFFSEEGLEEIDYDDLEDDPEMTFKSNLGWLGITDKYWAAILIPDQTAMFQGRFARQTQLNTEIFTASYIVDPFSLSAGETQTFTQHFFVGAKEVSLVDQYKTSLAIAQFDLLIDWGWFFFMTKPFFFVLDFFSKLVGNFGVAILIVTVLVKVVFFPLVNKSYQTMAVMRQMQPEIERIRAGAKGDMMAQNRKIAELWKKNEVKPLMGCLPMLLQIPVFFALYKVLFVTIEMRHAPFFGWINDLSAADPTSLLTLFGLIPLPLPDFLIIGIWPLLMGLSMAVQMRLNPPPPDPIQQKIFAWAPLVIMLLLARFPVGLVIYATWNTVLSALQQGFIMKRQGVKIDLLSNLGLKK